MARKPKASKTTPLIPPPVPVLPPTVEEIASEQQLLDSMRDMADRLMQRNLDNAVLLVQQAARRPTELSAHFGEIGRRFAHLLDGPPPKLKLRIVASAASEKEGDAI